MICGVVDANKLIFILDRKLVSKLLLDIMRIVRTLPRTEENILVSKKITNKA